MPAKSPDSGRVTRLLAQWRQGDADALEKLTPLVYGELRRLAAGYMRGERDGHSLQPTALVHEAFFRLVEVEVEWKDRIHFLSMAARLMRRVLIDHARRKKAAKRADGALQVTLCEERDGRWPAPVDLLDLETALERLRSQDERSARTLELHYFAGLSYLEIAEVMAISPATVDRDMRFAKAWLRNQLSVKSAGAPHGA